MDEDALRRWESQLKAQVHWMRQQPIAEIVHYVKELLTDIKEKSEIKGKNQALTYFTIQWNEFLLRKYEPFRKEVMLGLESKKQNTQKAELKGIDWSLDGLK
jgi:effector-binding domain-containing protein